VSELILLYFSPQTPHRGFERSILLYSGIFIYRTSSTVYDHPSQTLPLAVGEGLANSFYKAVGGVEALWWIRYCKPPKIYT
jgi:hypothetical protein